ncbi:PREDICTED: tetraspanin-8-like isoform X2 [Camelina sativa]|uniref:Tetraspanin-8-like isoform X1 n=1 Tax=Camelina sativa TaxID=90675 RepID=A0ABM0TPI4_CAMSA|nr:PREDICTED: tetraspanin-8-like isoform X1 [Camelina sativa]XP_010429338.1 PREDICTED: tetraspanin-8-like isoform X2 [Camelina sativa]
MVRCSNNLVGILNFLVFLLSIPILAGGIWLSQKGSTECERFLDKPVIALGVFLMVVAIAGLIGSCCRVTWLLWVYLFVMFLLILLVFCITVFAFVVTNKGAGEAIAGKGYKEYRLGDYSDWLQNRVNNGKNWNKIRSCLVESKVCSKLEAKFIDVPVNNFYQEHLTALQSGCCKPSDACGFEYVNPTTWNKNTTGTLAHPDCQTWDNAKDRLCFDCESCKAGLLDNVKSAWKKVAIVNIIFLVFLIIVYSVGCCAFRNNKRDDSYTRTYGYKP